LIRAPDPSTAVSLGEALVPPSLADATYRAGRMTALPDNGPRMATRRLRSRVAVADDAAPPDEPQERRWPRVAVSRPETRTGLSCRRFLVLSRWDCPSGHY